MTTPLVLSTLAVLTLAAAPSKSGAFPYPVKVTTLKNGLTVVRVPFDAPGLIAYFTVVRTGSRNEVEPGHSGFAHFFEHMMFRGTKRYPEGTRGAELAKLGFSENAYTNADMTVYYATGPAQALETLIDLEADRFANLEYSEPAFQTEAQAVAGEYNKNASRPGLKIAEVLHGAAYTTHPYRHLTIGFLDDITQMPTRYDYAQTFFKRWYTPDNCVVVVVGDFDDPKAMASIEAHYGPWQGRAATTVVPVEPPQKAARDVTLNWTSATLPRVVLAWHTPASTTKSTDAAVQQVLLSYLVGPTSPLYRSLVLEQQLVEALYSGPALSRDAGLFELYAHLKQESHRATVQQALLAAVAEVAKGKVDAPRLTSIKNNLRYGALMALETPEQVASALAVHIGIFGTPDAIDQHAAKVAAVTPKDLSTYAAKHLTDSNRTTLSFTVAQKGGTP